MPKRNVNKYIHYGVFFIHLSRFPFDWENPIGYLIAITLQLELISWNLRFMANLVSFGVACLLFTFQAAKDMKYDLHKINKNVKTKQTRSQTVEQLTEFIQFVTSRELSINSIIMTFRRF